MDTTAVVSELHEGQQQEDNSQNKDGEIQENYTSNQNNAETLENREEHNREQSNRLNYSNHREFLCKQVEQLVTDINAKRKRDTALIESCKKEMEELVSSSIQMLQSHVLGTYEKTEKVFEPKLKEFGEVIQRIETLETELEEYRGSIHQLYEELLSPFTAEV